MSWELHPARESFSRFAGDWDRLNAELFASHPYYDSRFIDPLLTHFATGNEWLCLCRQPEGVIAALILQPKGLGRWVSFRPAQAQIAPVLLGDSRLLNSLFSALPGVAWSIELHAVDPRYAPVFSQASGRVIISPRYVTTLVSAESGFDAYWALRPKKLRSKIRRYGHRLSSERGGVELTLVKAPEAMAEAVGRFGELETRGWKGAAGTAVSIDNSQGQFYSDVLANFAASGQAKVYELTLGDQLAASRMLLGNEKILVSLKIAHEESLARYAPGWLLQEGMLQRQLAEHPARTIEFYTNASREQIEWATAQQVIQDVHLLRNDVAMTLFSLAKALKRMPLQHPEKGEGQTEGHELTAGCSMNLEALPTAIHEEWCSPWQSIEESLDWFALLHKQVFPDDPGVIYGHASRGDRLIGILPMRLVRRRGVRSLESLSNYYTSLYAPMLAPEAQRQDLTEIISATVRQCGGADVMRFAPMDPASTDYVGLLQALRHAGWVPLTFFCFGNWYLKVQGGWEGYLKSRGGNLRSSIKRRTRDFAADRGTLEMVTCSQLDEAIEAYSRVYAGSWKKPEPYPDFVPSLIKLVSKHGMLRLGIARLQGQPVAAQLWIVGGAKASIYKVAYDDTYAEYSPGTVLTSFMMKHVIEADGVTEVDFLIGDDKYKELWMSHRRERWGIVAFNVRTLFGVLLLIKELFTRAIAPVVRRLNDLITRVSGSLKRVLTRRQNDLD